MACPIIYIPHGGGPLPLLGDPQHAELTRFLREWPRLYSKPSAIVVVSAHWESDPLAVTASSQPELLYDYSGFPPESYLIEYPAPGDLSLAHTIVRHFRENALDVRLDTTRGLDHGVFVPLKLMYPAADIPVIQLSLLAGLDAKQHIDIGRVLAEALDDDVLLLGSGMSFHNMAAFFGRYPDSSSRSRAFDDWLYRTLVADQLSWQQRRELLQSWQQAPQARFCHPREEHLLPLQVCFGAAMTKDYSASRTFHDILMNVWISGFVWDRV